MSTVAAYGTCHKMGPDPLRSRLLVGFYLYPYPHPPSPQLTSCSYSPRTQQAIRNQQETKLTRKYGIRQKLIVVPQTHEREHREINVWSLMTDPPRAVL